MVVVSKLRGRQGLRAGYHPRSRTMVFPSNQARVAAAEQAAGNWVTSRRLNGLGGPLDSIPPWALWGVGGLALGGVVGFFFLRKRRKRRR